MIDRERVSSESHEGRRGRPLRLAERDLLECFRLVIDLDQVRIYSAETAIGRFIGFWTREAAIALGHRIIAPGPLRLPILAHELAHVVQYERWGALRYFAIAFWNQVILRVIMRRDVYRWEYVPGKAFTDYGMEQQGQLVEDCFDNSSPRQSAARLVSPFTPL